MKDTIYDTYRKLIRESKYRWVIILGSLLYILSPIDISPDIIPIIGWIDDGLVLTLLITEVSQILMEKVKARKADANEVVTVETTVKDSETIDV
ncbi:MAG: DUF1232 domain-containing protein [Alkalinema sp. RU_4_3]|nr:DUF1232 domain-containing protein [Alkalinema sp. RU_4_3]